MGAGFDLLLFFVKSLEEAIIYDDRGMVSGCRLFDQSINLQQWQSCFFCMSYAVGGSSLANKGLRSLWGSSKFEALVVLCV